jgi:hypothetical protein
MCKDSEGYKLENKTPKLAQYVESSIVFTPEGPVRLDDNRCFG